LWVGCKLVEVVSTEAKGPIGTAYSFEVDSGQWNSSDSIESLVRWSRDRSWIFVGHWSLVCVSL